MRCATDGPQWFALWTRSRHEKAVAATLNTLGVCHYLPLRSEVRQWSDRKQAVSVPLFSGYLFVFLNPGKDSLLHVLRVPGVHGLVGNHMGISPIAEQQIEDIKTVLATGVSCDVQPVFEEGDRVRVKRGLLAGIEGTLVRAKSGTRLLVSIEMIRQSISITISPHDVELVGERLSPALLS
jgi:transcription antitermination factor NusG